MLPSKTVWEYFEYSPIDHTAQREIEILNGFVCFLFNVLSKNIVKIIEQFWSYCYTWYCWYMSYDHILFLMKAFSVNPKYCQFSCWATILDISTIIASFFFQKYGETTVSLLTFSTQYFLRKYWPVAAVICVEYRGMRLNGRTGRDGAVDTRRKIFEYWWMVDNGRYALSCSSVVHYQLRRRE